MYQFAIYIYKLIFDILFPRRCVSCGKYGQFLCFDCCRQIELIKTTLCPYCGKLSSKGEICPNCKRINQSKLNGILVCCHYDIGPIKKLISSLKYDLITDISEILGEVMTQKANEFSWTKYHISFVPISKKRERTRGFNQSMLLAKYVASQLNLPLSKLLIKTKDTPPQVGLHAKERIKNIKGVFHYNGPKMDKYDVLLIDDVATTNATLEECAKTLKEHGARKVYALVVASNK